jgi:hypothetical protein
MSHQFSPMMPASKLMLAEATEELGTSKSGAVSSVQNELIAGYHNPEKRIPPGVPLLLES